MKLSKDEANKLIRILQEMLSGDTKDDKEDDKEDNKEDDDGISKDYHHV